MSFRPLNRRFSAIERQAAVKASASTLFAFAFGVDVPVNPPASSTRCQALSSAVPGPRRTRTGQRTA